MAEIELRLTADLDSATREVAGFRKEYGELVKAVEKPLRQITGFRDLENSLESTERDARAARDRLRDLGNEMARAQQPSRQLQASYRDAASELARLERLQASQSGQLQRMGASLRAVGVDTSNLASEQRRLHAELSKGLTAGRADRDQASARAALGVGAIEDAQRELLRLRQQYQLVTADGSLSAKQRSEAEAAYRRQVGQTLEQLRRLRAATAAPVSKRDRAAQEAREAQAQAAALQLQAQAAAEAARQEAILTARRRLGVGVIQQQQQELVALRREYALVRADGSLSAVQRAEAEVTYHRAVERSLAKLRELRTAMVKPTPEAARQGALDEARQGLGVGAIRAQQQALLNLRRQYALLRTDATLTATERAEAEATYRMAVDRTLAKLRALRAAMARPDSARETLGLNRLRELQQQLVNLEHEYRRLTTSATLSASQRSVVEAQYRRRVEETRRAIAQLTQEQAAAGKSGSGMLGKIAGGVSLAGGAYAATQALGAYVQLVDETKKMDAQVKLVTKSQEEFNRVQADLFSIAQANQAPLADITTLYSRLQPAMAQMGRGSADTLNIVDAVTKSLRISGATVAETASTVTQFSQALGSGVLRGEEFNSIAENSPRLLRALAEGLHVPTGALRGMAAEGKLTSEVIADLTLRALPELTEEAAKLPDTVEGSFTRLRNEALKAFDGADTTPLVDSISQLRDLLTDPQFVQGMTNLAGGMMTVARWAAQVVSEFAALGREAGFAVAQATGQVSELTRLGKLLEGLKSARDGGNLVGRPAMTYLMSPEDIERWIRETEAQIARLNQAISTTPQAVYAEHAAHMREIARQSLEAGSAAVQGQRVQGEALLLDQRKVQQSQEALKQAQVDREKELEDKRFALLSASREQLKEVRDQSVKDLKKSVKEQESAERKAISALAAIRKERLAMEQKYADALTKLNSGSAKGPSTYMDAQRLKVQAKDALKLGDVEKAKKLADQALQVLLDIQEAGGNTYGFAGLAKELKAVEGAAFDIQTSRGEEKLAHVRERIVDLKELIDGLKAINLEVYLDEGKLAEVKRQLVELYGGAQYFQPVVEPYIPYPTAPQPSFPTQPVGGAAGGGSATPVVPVTIKPVAIDQSAEPPTIEVKPEIVKDGENSWTNRPTEPATVEAKIKPVGIEESSEPPTLEVEGKLIFKDGTNSWTNVAPEGWADVPPVDATVVVDQESVANAEQQVQALAQRSAQALTIPLVIPGVVQDGPNSWTNVPPDTPARAQGGPIYGPGTSTSDSILTRLSNGEFVVRESAVRHYGVDFLHQLNQKRFGSLQAFAEGGQVGARNVPYIPPLSPELLQSAAPAAMPHLGTLDLRTDAGTHQVQVNRSVAEEMRLASLKRGKSNAGMNRRS